MLVGVGPTQDVPDLGTDMIAWFDADDDMPFEDFMLQPIDVRHKGLDDAHFRHMVTNTLASHLYPSTTTPRLQPRARRPPPRPKTIVAKM
ncbi:hypothetical protein SPRG_18379 [Saprolegnia parasitica CBS 223.65]|uniref:Uncharacterized protein n=1 Tax=Saprolegnia parasitica (strain CBS 223.65) TaxID=695850 RepID=A0A067BH54_SAPPC|nr:hypothetical protein SPRG_18379 [Saprolegnia parasitica CBS 223.65]KDO16085.1 hypothetical protein SPRG_18379 [Saprolegnia parasitica CBS 223.65]|eukprot:XP_012213206.1 hypothetical protein SPRG_18379 [Saprolegnia parasitica CBS 223.65]